MSHPAPFAAPRPRGLLATGAVLVALLCALPTSNASAAVQPEEGPGPHAEARCGKTKVDCVHPPGAQVSEAARENAKRDGDEAINPGESGEPSRDGDGDARTESRVGAGGDGSGENSPGVRSGPGERAPAADPGDGAGDGAHGTGATPPSRRPSPDGAVGSAFDPKDDLDPGTVMTGDDWQRAAIRRPTNGPGDGEGGTLALPGLDLHGLLRAMSGAGQVGAGLLLVVMLALLLLLTRTLAARDRWRSREDGAAQRARRRMT